MKIIKLLFGEYWYQRYRLWMKKIRLKRAIKLAEKLHELNNGMRYFVLEVDYKPGHYKVLSMPEIKALQKLGAFSDRAKFTDFLREAKYYTKSGVRFNNK